MYIYICIFIYISLISIIKSTKMMYSGFPYKSNPTRSQIFYRDLYRDGETI